MICSCSNYLKYMENFDYQSILVDSGSIVQWGEGRLFGASAEFFFL